MDDFSINGVLLRDTMDKLAAINRWLGGNKVTMEGLKKLLRKSSKDMPLTIVDLGCGGGDILRDVAKFGRKNGFNFNLIGIDANEDAVIYARELSLDYPEISYRHINIFSEEFKTIDYDIVLTTLFLHHFNQEQLVNLLSKLLKKARLGIVVNDLHRNALAYYLFRLLCTVIPNKMVKEDGLTSVLKGFKRKELATLSSLIQVKPNIKWKWAFRYQWIINKD